MAEESSTPRDTIGEGGNDAQERGPANVDPSNWIRFLRGYGPVSRNENMYDEFIRRTARRLGVTPIEFEHPARMAVVEGLCGTEPTSIILTGTAGDGKTHICRRVWEALGADPEAWQSKDPHLVTTLQSPGGGHSRTLHVIRDLSAWAPQRGVSWDPSREEILQRFSSSLFQSGANDELFVIAANDGQLVDAWHRLRATDAVRQANEAIETLLVDDMQALAGVSLRLFNLSRHSSAVLFERALAAFLEHPGWSACRDINAAAGEFYGPDCPIRHNVELLATPIVRSRLQALFSLCDYNRFHIPIRQILLLLVNGVLGHPDAKEGLLAAKEIPTVLRSDTASKASLYNNLFGGNLSDARRQSRLVFEAFSRFGIGHETSNRIDNILIFGEADETLRPYFDRYLRDDRFCGASPSFRAAQREYIEGASEHEERSQDFLQQLVGQRRGLFFKIPDDEADELRLWELTVFKFAGEYLDRVVASLEAGRRVERPVLSRLVRGLNRVFTGMLLSTDREIIVATGLAVSAGRVNRLVEDRVSVEPRLGERVDVVLRGGVPTLEVTLSPDAFCRLPLHLTRYEFLSRVAQGVLPSSFSRECYEDMLAFKSLLLTKLADRRTAAGELRPSLAFQLLEADDSGKAAVVDLEVRDV